MAVSVSDSYRVKITRPSLPPLFLSPPGLLITSAWRGGGAGPRSQHPLPASPTAREQRPAAARASCGLGRRLPACRGSPGLAKTLWDVATARKTSPRPCPPAPKRESPPAAGSLHGHPLPPTQGWSRGSPRLQAARVVPWPDPSRSDAMTGDAALSPRLPASPPSPNPPRPGGVAAALGSASAAGGTAFFISLPFCWSLLPGSPDPRLGVAAGGRLGRFGSIFHCPLPTRGAGFPQPFCRRAGWGCRPARYFLITPSSLRGNGFGARQAVRWGAPPPNYHSPQQQSWHRRKNSSERAVGEPFAAARTASRRLHPSGAAEGSHGRESGEGGG